MNWGRTELKSVLPTLLRVPAGSMPAARLNDGCLAFGFEVPEPALGILLGESGPRVRIGL